MSVEKLTKLPKTVPSASKWQSGGKSPKFMFLIDNPYGVPCFCDPKLLLGGGADNVALLS